MTRWGPRQSYKKFWQSLYTLSRNESDQPSATLHHQVELDAATKSYVVASVGLESDAMELYYRGPAADTERLAEELVGKAGNLFGRCVSLLRQKLEQVLRQMDKKGVSWV